ncbi:hypothetical protein ES705_43000 [subsurface metagenome]
MANIDWFYKKLLEYFSKHKECYHNLFNPNSNFLEFILNHEPTQKDKVLAQKAFKKLIDDGLIFDANGNEWYTITDEGKKVLESGFPIPRNDTIETFLKKYDLHSKVKSVSAGLFADTHYKEAIQASLVEVIRRVKEVAGYPKNNAGQDLDGDKLMNRVFGCDGKNQPLIKLNELGDSLDRAEQRGFMNLFKGIVGVRDKKAHLNFIQHNPYMTMEYLTLASLLMRLLDEDFIKKFNK